MLSAACCCGENSRRPRSATVLDRIGFERVKGKSADKFGLGRFADLCRLIGSGRLKAS